MPSSLGYKRDYKREAAIETPERKKERAARNRAHRAFQAALGHKVPVGMDVDHKNPLSEGGAKTKMSNLRMEPAHKNRSYARTRSGAIKRK